MNLTTHTSRTSRRFGALIFTALVPFALVSCSNDSDNAPETVAEDTTASSTSSESSEQESQEYTEPTGNSSETKKKPNPTLGSSAPKQPSEETSPTASKPPQQAKGKCHWTKVEDAVSKPGRNVVSMYCDSFWAYVGTYQTDATWIERFNGREWEEVAPDSERTSGMGGRCYTPDYLRGLGAPEGLIEVGATCEL
ncbi:hypothetical protein ACN4DW_00780 [Corynebacterium macclintockiae]|uniref:hypothetical protein n=1 Tax=Corynebacterium macclintockiae TaxID=2913501 RepID=UPI003EB732B5